MIILFCILWFISGVSGYIYWRSLNGDITTEDILIMILIGIMLGPTAFFFGWLIEAPPRNKSPFVFFKQRK